jgi:hypothetical protein
VSTVTAGPDRPSVYAMRPDAMLDTTPVTRWPATLAGASWIGAPYSLWLIPT